MDWPEEIAGGLPSPPDEQAESLRQDIADELADHLQAALARQLVKTPNADEARAQVLKRFGDPLAIARQLWFDALRGKLMSQRLLLTITLLMAVTCIAAVTVAWIMIRQGQASVAALMAESRAAAEQSRADNDALRAQLEQISAATKPIDWKPPLKVQLVQDQPDGPPAAGFKVVLRPGAQPGKPIAERASGADGLVDFGAQRPEDYVLNVYTPWEEYYQRSIDHRPGDERIERIICPTAPASTQDADIKASVDWPDDLREQKLFVICRFWYAHLRRNVAGCPWTSLIAGSAPEYGTRWLVLAPNGEMHVIEAEPKWDQRDPKDFYPFQLKADGPAGDLGFRMDKKAPRFYFGLQEDLPTVPSVRWPEGTYRLSAMSVASERHETPEDALRRLDVLGLFWTQSSSFDRRSRRESDLELYERMPPLVVLNPVNQPQFDANAGQPNLWTLSIPTDLLEKMRERLSSTRN